MGNLAFSIKSLVFLQNCWIPEIVIFGIATSEPAQPQWWWWKQEYKERNWFNKQNKYFECTAHFLYISLLSLHIINILKLDRKGIAIVGVVSMIIASSRVGLWFPPKYPCRVSQVQIYCYCTGYGLLVYGNTNLGRCGAERKWRHITNLWVSFCGRWVRRRTSNGNGCMTTTRRTVKTEQKNSTRVLTMKQEHLGWQVETHQNVLLGSDTSSVWNFCVCSSDVILHGNQWWSCKMLAVFLG